MENNLALVVPDQLEEIVKNSGLEIAEGEQIKQSYMPFLQQLAEIQEQSVKINFANPVELDETIARELRLKTVKIRTGASDLKDSRKRIHLLKGNLEQAAFNLIAASCKLAEDVFVNVEKAREIAESKRKAGLRQERFDELFKYGWLNTGIDLGMFDEKQYQFLLTGIKKEYEDKIAAEKKAEDDRIAKEKADKEERDEMIAANLQLQKEAEAREKAIAEERKVQAAKLAEEQAKAKKEAEAREKIEKELQAKKDAEIKAAKEAEANAAADLKAKQEAEMKAAAAPDKEKLLSFISNLIMPEMGMKTFWGQTTEKVIRERFEGFIELSNRTINAKENSLGL
jgi:colicin import membrane protein